jgi:hypothetical protein
VAWIRPQTEFLERTPEKTASSEPSTKDSIETVRLCASLIRACLSIETVSPILPLF